VLINKNLIATLELIDRMDSTKLFISSIDVDSTPYGFTLIQISSLELLIISKNHIALLTNILLYSSNL
jgi:hypothetical protein